MHPSRISTDGNTQGTRLIKYPVCLSFGFYCLQQTISFQGVCVNAFMGIKSFYFSVTILVLAARYILKARGL